MNQEKPMLPGTFAYIKGALHIEKVNLVRLAKAYPTPLYVYSKKQIEKNVNAIQQMAAPIQARLYYAVKANPRLAILKLIKAKGFGAEAVSMGEIQIALKAGFAPKNILFNGNGKTQDEVAFSLNRGVRLFNFDSLDQLELLEATAKKQKTKCEALMRVKPEIETSTHAHLAVGRKGTKFGLSPAETPEVFKRLASLKHVQITGIHTHFGSQLLEPEPFLEAARLSLKVVRQLATMGVDLSIINLGGGFGIPYREEHGPLDLKTLAKGYQEIFSPSPRLQRSSPEAAPLPNSPALFLEPGRDLVGNAGIILSRVVSIKKDGDRVFYVLDAAMTENPRPSLYQARHRIVPVLWKKPETYAQVVGPVCENADSFGSFALPRLQVGGLAAILDTGAYTSVMSMTYNGRPHPAEILVEGSKARVIRQRDSWPDLWRLENF